MVKRSYLKGGGRAYKWPGAEHPLPSVTTIIRHAWPSPELDKWKLRLVAIAWRDQVPVPEGSWTGAQGLNKLASAAQSKEAANRGSRVHAAVEMLMNGEELAHGPVRLAAQVVLDSLERLALSPMLSEAVVAHPQLGWAGTLDLAGQDKDGQSWVADLKTGRAIWDDHYVQVAAYASAVEIAFKGQFVAMPDVGRRLIIHLPLAGSAAAPQCTVDPRVIELDGNQLAWAEEVWATCLQVWRLSRAGPPPRALQPALSPSSEPMALAKFSRPAQ